jgi:RNA polymerase primary sigma factor
MVTMNAKQRLDASFTGGELGDVRFEMLDAYRGGASALLLAERHDCSERQVRRLIRRARFERISELPLEYMPSDDFDSADAEQKIVAPLPEPERATRRARIPSGLPSYLASLYEVSLLTAAQEAHLFRKYNYLKYRAANLRETLDEDRPSARTMSEIERLHQEAVGVKNQLVRANLRLVVSIAKKHVSSPEELFERISEGNISVMRAVEKFDYTRGFKFSTYATWAIKRNFIRAYGDRMRRIDRFRTSREELLDAAVEQRSNPYVELRAQDRREAEVSKILDCLTHRERDIIGRRFGLGRMSEGETFKQIGDDFGLSKERIRQIEQRALAKLREAAEQQRIEFAA